MSITRVALVGATGETGRSILEGLLEAGNFSIVALTRPASVDKPANAALQDRGVEVRVADLSGPENELVEALKNIDIVVSAIGPHEQHAQIPLATAAKKAGVKRFLPCGFITVAPPGGVMMLRDWKEDVYNHIKHIALPYTIVDVGWWYQISLPRLPSGRIDSFVPPIGSTLINSGEQPSALTDLRDIGRYIAAIITDGRTLNRYVLAYNELLTPNQVCDKLERLSGEQIPRSYIPEADLRQKLADANEKLKTNPADVMAGMGKVTAEYQISWGVRGDNTPEYAKYLGYLTSKDLYPEITFRSFDSFVQEVLDGKLEGVYQSNDAMTAMMEKMKK